MKQAGRTLQKTQTKMQYCQADRPAQSTDHVLLFRPHPDLFAKKSTVLARPIYSTAGLLDWGVEHIFAQNLMLCRNTGGYQWMMSIIRLKSTENIHPRMACII